MFFDDMTGKSVINKEPVYHTEWVMEIRPIPGHEVAIYKIKDFLLEARKMGYPIKVVSTDGFQSSNLRQDLTLRKIDCKLISCDRNKDPYNYLRNTILESRLTAPNLEKLVTEVSELEEGDQKFDHPSTGSKDILDALCGSVWSCSQHIHEMKVMTTQKDVNAALDALINNGASAHDRFEQQLLSKINNK